MKNKRFVSFFTIMLILFQSFSAVANSLDFHATDPQHLQQEHQHSDDHIFASVNEEPTEKPVNKLKNVDDINNNQHNPADCHHCGHCNATHVQWLGQSVTRSTDLAHQSHQFHYLRAVLVGPVNLLLRPPKV